MEAPSLIVASPVATNVKVFGGLGVGDEVGVDDVGVLDGVDDGGSVGRMQVFQSLHHNKHGLPRSVLSQFL